MGIFDRLGDLIKSYLNDEDSRIFGRSRGRDPDMEEAEAELESFLRGGRSRAETEDWGDSRAQGASAGAWDDRGSRAGGTSAWGDSRTGGASAGAWDDRGSRARRTSAWGDGRARRTSAWGDGRARRTSTGAWDDRERRAPEGTPEKLRPDFAELGLPFGAGPEECKAAYRRLLKLHHPDRHAGHQGNMEKATRKMAKINAAYDRIERWRAGEEL